MNDLKWFSILMICLAFTGCQFETRHSPGYYGNDFDNYVNWGFSHQLLTTEDAYSGKYSCVTDASNEYSMGLKISNGELDELKPKYFIVSAWVKSEKSQPHASIVATFDDGSTNISWNGVHLGKQLKMSNKWVLLTEKFRYPKNVTPKTEFSCFLWNTSGQKIYIDDLSVEFFR